MPVLPSSRYTTVETALTLARALINDMMSSTAGEILKDDDPYTFPLLNSAALYMENELKNRGVKTFVKESVLSIPVLGVIPNPEVQVFLADGGFYDGYQNFNPPQLPTDMQVPMLLWECMPDSLEVWQPMQQFPDGLPSVSQSTRLRFWEWRTDRIYMPGATQVQSLKMRYESDSMTFQLPTDTVMVKGSNNALANLVAALFTNSRNPGAAATFAAAADQMIDQIARQNTRARQRMTITRRSYGSQAWYNNGGTNT